MVHPTPRGPREAGRAVAGWVLDGRQYARLQSPHARRYSRVVTVCVAALQYGRARSGAGMALCGSLAGPVLLPLRDGHVGYALNARPSPAGSTRARLSTPIGANSCI